MKTLKSWLERILRVPPEPRDPMGEEATLQVFHASPKFLRYQLFSWLITVVLMTAAGTVPTLIAIGVAVAAAERPWAVAVGALAALAVMAATVAFAVVSYLSVRIDFDYRWYKVTDRSLRIREGVFLVREVTMTFANIQNLSVSQGPLQRWFGIADLKVESAGGAGSGQAAGKHGGTSFNMHVGYFRGLDDVEEIRALMMDRLRRLKDTGLGDTDEAAEETPTPAAELDLLAAIRDEAKGLKAAAAAL